MTKHERYHNSRQSFGIEIFIWIIWNHWTIFQNLDARSTTVILKAITFRFYYFYSRQFEKQNDSNSKFNSSSYCKSNLKRAILTYHRQVSHGQSWQHWGKSLLQGTGWHWTPPSWKQERYILRKPNFIGFVWWTISKMEGKKEDHICACG